MTREYASGLAGGAVEAIGAIKQAAVGGLERPLEDGLARERDLVAGLFRSHDAREGLNAFIEKREPAFGQA